jgi:ATP-dependent Clp protease ATP-binding subunit ClpC
MKDSVISELRKSFNPEFLNRIDDVVVFHPLAQDHLVKIIGLLVDELNATTLADRGIQLEVELAVKDWIIQENFQPTYGARPLRRAIQKYIADPLSEAILKGRFKDSPKVRVMLKDGMIELQEEEADVLAKV